MNQPPSRSDKILNLLSFVFAIFGLVLFFIYITSQNHHFGTDWVTSFKPATLALIHGENIYLESYKFFNPPWIVFPLIPFAFLPDRIVSIFFLFLSIVTFGFVAYKMGASLFLTIFFAFSPFVIRCGNDPNIDWLIAIGYLLPPQIGLFFVLAKPQIGLAVALYWLVQTWKIGRLKLVLKTFLPVIICFLISFIFYGLWPLNSISLGNVAHNSSLWPYSIPIGFFLFFYGLYKKNLGYSIISTPLISPYVGPVSWAAPLLGALPNNWLFMLFIIVTWIIQFISHRPM